MKSFYADVAHHQRLMSVVDQRLGHALIARAEAAKIAVADGGAAMIDLSLIERGLEASIDEARAVGALDADLERIVQAGVDTLGQAGLGADRVDALYFTGGSTGFRPLAERIAACFPAARVMRGDRFASVAQGLGVHARRVFAAG
jgi:hypothetical chaperone protein